MNLVHATDISVDSKHIVGLSVDGQQIYNTDMDYVAFNMTTPDDGTTCDLYKIDSKYVDNGELRLRINENRAWNDNFLSTSHAINSQNADSISSINVHSTKISSIGNSCFDGFANLKEFSTDLVYKTSKTSNYNNAIDTTIPAIQGFIIPIADNAINCDITEITFYTYGAENNEYDEIFLQCGIADNQWHDNIKHTTNFTTDLSKPGKHTISIDPITIQQNEKLVVFFKSNKPTADIYNNRIAIPVECSTLENSRVSDGVSWHENKGPKVEVKYSLNIKKLGWRSFLGCTSLKDIQLNEVTEINGGAFFGCTNLSNIELDKLSTITNMQTFANCSNLSSISLPSLKTIIEHDNGKEQFANCIALTSIDLPELTSVNSTRLFSNCTSLKELNFPKVIEISRSDVFNNCTSLTSITLDSVLDIKATGSSIFSSCPNLSAVNLPNLSATGWKSLADSNLTSIIAPKLSAFYSNGTSHEGQAIFYNNHKLKTINIDSMPIITEWCFQHCSDLLSISLPAVHTIRQQSFDNCTTLSSIYLSKNLTSIESNAFTNCPNLKTVYVDDFINEDGKSETERISALITGKGVDVSTISFITK